MATEAGVAMEAERSGGILPRIEAPIYRRHPEDHSYPQASIIHQHCPATLSRDAHYTRGDGYRLGGGGVGSALRVKKFDSLLVVPRSARGVDDSSAHTFADPPTWDRGEGSR